MAGLSGKTSHLRQSFTKALSRPRRFHFPRPLKMADLPYSLGQATKKPFQIRLFRAIDRSRNRNACSAGRRPSRRTGHIDHRKPTRPFSSMHYASFNMSTSRDDVRDGLCMRNPITRRCCLLLQQAPCSYTRHFFKPRAQAVVLVMLSSRLAASSPWATEMASPTTPSSASCSSPTSILTSPSPCAAAASS